MDDRFQILKAKNFDGRYAVIDSYEQQLVGMADSIKEAKRLKLDIERMIFQDKIVDEAMKNLGLFQ